MIVGGYTMHLYCDAGNEKPGMPGDSGKSPHNWRDPGAAEFHSWNERQCRLEAKKAGWRFMRDGRVICPRCNK